MFGLRRYVHLLLTLLLTLCCYCASRAKALEVSGLAEFFNSTFIRRETAEWNPKIKEFSAAGYSHNWDMYSLHNVCIQKGYFYSLIFVIKIIVLK